MYYPFTFVLEPNDVSTVEVKNATNSTITTEWTFVKSDGYILMWKCQSPNTDSHMHFEQSNNVSLNTSTVANLDPGTKCTVNITSYILNYDHGILYGSPFIKALDKPTNEEGIFKSKSWLKKIFEHLFNFNIGFVFM